MFGYGLLGWDFSVHSLNITFTLLSENIYEVYVAGNVICDMRKVDGEWQINTVRPFPVSDLDDLFVKINKFLVDK